MMLYFYFIFLDKLIDQYINSPGPNDSAEEGEDTYAGGNVRKEFSYINSRRVEKAVSVDLYFWAFLISHLVQQTVMAVN